MPTLAHQYAGILGTLAMSVVMLRAIKDSSASASVLWTAIGLLAAFAAAGFVIGWIADATVVSSVRAQFDEELQKETRRAEQNNPAKPTLPQG
jgi:hypothetical protein